MIQNLKIENYALIRELNLNFSSGLTVITGETGAGKSIMLGALALILGQRADTSVLLDKEKKCIVEGTFHIASLNLQAFFEENDLDFDNQTVLRREIIPSGKSRAFVNDTPVSLDILKQLGEKLVDIHSQHKTLTINESSFQMDVVNTFIKDTGSLIEYQKLFISYQKTKQNLETLVSQEQQLKADADYIQFLFDELHQAKLIENEQENLTQELELLNNAEFIKTHLFQATQLIDNGETSILLQLGEVKNLITKVAGIHPRFAEVSNRCQEAYIELKDIYAELARMEDEVQVNAEQQEIYNQRLDLIYKLQHKHGVATIAELLAIEQELEQKLASITSSEEQILLLQKELETLEIKLTKLAQELHQERKEAAKHIQSLLLPILSELGMPSARFELEVNKTNLFNVFGMDSVRFLFNANLGAELKELSKVISGGEMSRLMMALKSIINTQNILPTVIFDEIDSGISGDIAGKAAKLMQQMATTMQVISISHLPQIAAQAQTHYKVYKQVEGQITYSAVKKLTQDERIEEIAKMLSSEKVSQAAIDTAKVLLGVN